MGVPVEEKDAVIVCAGMVLKAMSGVVAIVREGGKVIATNGSTVYVENGGEAISSAGAVVHCRGICQVEVYGGEVFTCPGASIKCVQDIADGCVRDHGVSTIHAVLGSTIRVCHSLVSLEFEGQGWTLIVYEDGFVTASDSVFFGEHGANLRVTRGCVCHGHNPERRAPAIIDDVTGSIVLVEKGAEVTAPEGSTVYVKKGAVILAMEGSTVHGELALAMEQ